MDTAKAKAEEAVEAAKEAAENAVSDALELAGDGTDAA